MQNYPFDGYKHSNAQTLIKNSILKKKQKLKNH